MLILMPEHQELDGYSGPALKEANLYLAKKGRKYVAVKIYLQETSDFRNMTRYIRGDPRFTSRPISA